MSTRFVPNHRFSHPLIVLLAITLAAMACGSPISEPQPASSPSDQQAALNPPTASASAPGAPFAVPGMAYIDGRDPDAVPPLTLRTVNVWGEVPRKRVVCSLAHAYPVQLVESTYLAAEERYYFRVDTVPCDGWLPESFLSAESNPPIGDWQ